MWAVLTRLEEPKKASLTLLQKLKLYNGRTLPGFTEDNIKELRKETQREGMEGISPRYIQDKISNALVSFQEDGYINPFMVLSELEGGLKNHALINAEEDRAGYKDLLSVEPESTPRSSRTRFSARSRPTRRRSSGSAATISTISKPTPSASGPQQVHRPERGA